jgi:hypothetical protein
MTVDVDAVNEKLNGLVNLLHVVGIDGVDPDALVEEQRRLSAAKKGSSAPQTSQSSDAQILEIIKKLQQAQADSPEILAALKSPELRALASLAAQKQGAKPEPVKKAAPTLDEVMDEDDSYPKIGPGYSDDISVVSDLTTPTIMPGQHIADEEHYKDINGGAGNLPPMHIGMGPAQPSRPPGQISGPPIGGGSHHAPKTKNLVGQVRPGATRRAIAKTGGAAAQRRLNYQQAMAKLQSNEYGSPVAGKQEKNYMEHFSPKKTQTAFFSTSPTPSKLPSELPSLADQGKKGRSTRNKAAVSSKKGKKTALASQEVSDFELDSDPNEPKHEPPASATTSVESGSKKKSKDKSSSKGLDWGGGGGGGGGGDTSAWPAFDDAGGKDTFNVDNDGFFSNDVFGSGSDPFGAPASASKSMRSIAQKTEKKVIRDDGQGGTRSRKSKKDNEWASDANKATKKEGRTSLKKGKSRRASLSM